jgi:hypothetical protein
MTHIEKCQNCGMDIPMTEEAHARFMDIASRGICCLIWCDECREEIIKRDIVPLKVHKVLPLP